MNKNLIIISSIKEGF